MKKIFIEVDDKLIEIENLIVETEGRIQMFNAKDIISVEFKGEHVDVHINESDM